MSTYPANLMVPNLDAAAVAGFADDVPGLLGRMLAVPPFGALAELGYRLFLRARKLWR